MTRVKLQTAPLPRPVVPFPGELLDSYLRRLSHANRLDPIALRRFTAGGDRHWSVPISRLAIIAGIPVATLEHAIGDLDGGKSGTFYVRQISVHPWTDGPACQLCALAHGAQQPVRCRKKPEEVVCLRHRRWIGTASTTQPSLAGQPGILQAHKQHLRLVRRFGRDETMIGFAFADHICQQWREYRQHDAGFRHRMETFHGPSWEVPAAHPTIAAAAYPQVVALTRLLTTPYWRALATDFSNVEHPLFVKELHETVAPGLGWPQPSYSKDPLHRWLLDGRRRTRFDF